MAAAALTREHKYIDERFLRLAELSGLSSDDVRVLERYAKRLEDNGVPVIFDSAHLSKLLGQEVGLLYAISNAPGRFYRTFSVPKKAGGFRKIDEPLPTLKEIQRFVLDNILAKVSLSKASKAFSAKSSIKKNARIHLRQPVILKVDIKDFFPSIVVGRVRAVFFELGYTSQLSTLFARICCFENCLPQGAPTSPALANIICRGLDEDLLNYCLERGLRYTRYADDIAISGRRIAGVNIHDIRNTVKRHRFSLNERKTNILRDGSRKVVTGIVVNEKMTAPRAIRREFRKNIYYIRKYGVDGHVRRINERRKNYLLHLMGIAIFIRWVDRMNTTISKDLAFLRQLQPPFARRAEKNARNAEQAGVVFIND